MGRLWLSIFAAAAIFVAGPGALAQNDATFGDAPWNEQPVHDETPLPWGLLGLVGLAGLLARKRKAHH